MPRSLSLTALQVNALTTSDDTILYNAQARDISLYGGTNLASLLTQLEIDNVSGDCLTLRCNGNADNYANFKMNSSGTFDVKINNGNKSFNIVNHNGSTFGLRLNGTLVTSTAAELNKLSGFTGNFNNLDYLTGITPGTATAGKALVTDSNNDLVGLNNLSTQNLTVAGTLVTASATELNYTDITTAGTAQAAKALVVDLNKDISGIRNLSATNLTGTLQTASQPNITSVGTLANLTVSNQITTDIIDASTILVDGVDITTAISGSDPTTGITPGVVSASKVLLVDSSKNLTGMGNLTSTGTITASTLAGTLSTASQPNVTTLAGVTSIGASSATALTGTLATAAQGNITSVGTLTGLTSNGNVNLAEHNGIDKGLQLGGTLVTAAASEINKLTGLTASTSELNTNAGVTPGTVSASKALVVDGNKDLSGIRNITTTGTISGAVGVSATTLTGTLATASQPNITSVGTLSGLTVTNQINVGTLDAAAILVNGVDITTAISGSDPTTGITPGVVSASKVLLVDSSKNLTGMGNLTSTGTITASTLAGTLSTASQSNITSVGTLTSLTSNGDVNINEHDGSTKGLQLAGTLVTSTASDLNKLAGVTNGTTSASKALVVDSNKDLSAIRNITSTGTVSATTLTGTLSTASQSNITSIGTLTSLTSNGDLNVAQHDGSTTGLQLQGTLVTATAADLNKLSGVTEGTVSSSKVIIVDTNKDLSGIRNLTTTGTISGVTTLTATTVAGTLSTASQPNITSVGTLTSLTSNGDVDIAEHDGSTKGLKLAGTLVNATATDLNKLSNVTASAADLNTTTGVTAGTVTASKHLVVDSNKDLTGMGDLTSTGTITASTISGTTLTGTLSAGAQNNVTTLTGATSVGKDSSTTLTGTLATASQPNVTTLAGVTSIGASNTTTLTGTLQTAAQPNVTSVGTLTSLALSGEISGATTISNSSTITNTDTTASSSNSTGAVKLSGGIGISNTTDATSSTNGGTFTTAGGAAIAKKLYVGSDLTVGGNLTISGITTTINSTTTIINDNTLLLNSGPSGTGFDAGVLTQRYQVDNSAGTGDVVSDTAKESYAISSATTSTITLPSSASSTNDYYNNWWVKITSGTLINNVRKITAYNGTTKEATLSTVLGSAPSSNDNVNLYNKSYTSLLWNESSKKFVSAFTSNDTSTPGALTIIDYADFTAKNITGTLATASQPNITSVGTLTSLTSSGAVSTSGNISTTGTGTITSAGLLTASAGLTVTGTLTLGSTAVTATATKINYTDVTTIGTAEASKALVLDSSRNITNINSLTATNLTGTLATASQPNITSIGTLTSLTSSGAVSVTNSTASTSSSTGALQVAGGAYFGANSLFAGNVNIGTGANVSTITSSGIGSTTATDFSIFTGATNGLRMRFSGNSNNIFVNTNTPIGTSNNNNVLVILETGLLIGNTNLSTPSWTTSGIQLRTGATTFTNNSTASSGTAASAVFNSFAQPTLAATNTSVTTTNASTLYIANSPAAGTNMTITNSYALWVEAGNCLFGANLTLNGASSTLSLSGASSIVTLSNTTASTSSSTGALQVAGGAYFGANSLFNANLTLQGASSTLSLSGASSVISISNTTASTSSSTGALRVSGGAYFGANSLFNANLTLQGASSTLSLSGASSVISISNTTASTSSTTGALRVAGGAYFGANSLFGANLTLNGAASLNTQNIGNVRTTLPTSYVSINDSPIYFRGTGGSDKNHFLCYAGNTAQTNWNSGKGFGNPGTANDGPVLCGNNNVIIGTLASSGTETICANFTSTNTDFNTSISITNSTASTSSSTGALRVSGGAYFGAASVFASNVNINGTLTTTGLSISNLSLSGTTASTSSTTGALQVAGGAYFGANSIFNSTLRVMGQSAPTAGEGIEFGYSTSTANIYSYDRTGGTYKNINLNDKMYIKSDGTIGIGTSTPTYKLDLGSTATNMNLSLYGGLYGFGACNNNLQSFSDNGFTWHTVNSAVTGTGAAPGTQIGKLYSTGHFEASSGIRAGEYSAPSYTGSGIEMHYSTSQGFGDIFSYDRTIGTYRGLRLNANLYISLGGYVGIGTTYPLFPLHVANTTASGTSYNYYQYFGPGSSNGSTTGAPSSVSIKTDGRILVTGEVDVISDIRTKENIKSLDLNYCKSFVNIIKPISFNYKTSTGDINYGYIAQDIIKNNFTELITVHTDDSIEEFIDSDGFKSEAGHLYSVSKNDIVPILHMVVKDQQTKINELKQKNIDLETRLAKLEAFISTLEIAE